MKLDRYDELQEGAYVGPSMAGGSGAEEGCQLGGVAYDGSLIVSELQEGALEGPSFAGGS